ncbi:MAG: alkaline phosphatase D family protein [Opitutaceae bacterium]|nr:alkaline phosphatase D family protein [Opitutaceae bacterium]
MIRPAPFRLALSLLLLLPAAADAGGRSAAGIPRLMQGPMAGASGPDTIRIWVRASGPHPVVIRYGTAPGLDGAATTPAVTPRAEDDFTAVCELTGLQPDTAYYYRVLVAGEIDDAHDVYPPFQTRTAPPAGRPARFRVAFGSCANYNRDRRQDIWTQVALARPDLFLWTGDNIYGDSLQPAILAEEYRRQRDVATLRPLLPVVPQLAVWDDHDYGLNNHDREHPGKADSLRVFRHYWANPAYGQDGDPGVYFRHRHADVDFFLLDTRYHRDPNAAPDGPGHTMLGARQLAWLRDGLAASTAPFKVLVSGSGWNTGTGPGGDSWSSFLHERNALFDFLRDRGITGVVLVSGDSHVGELNCIPWSARGGYDLYELVSSPLAQRVLPPALEPDPELRLRPPHSGSNFGLLEIDTTLPDPVLRFSLLNPLGHEAFPPLELRASDLRNGARTWPRHFDDGAREWYEHSGRAVPAPGSERVPR